MKQQFTPSLIHSIFFKQYTHPIEINWGQCFHWAYIAYKLFDNVELWSSQYHAFIKFGNRYFDSEHLNGIKNWKKIRTIKEYYGSAVRHSEKQFKLYWGQYNIINWGELDSKVNFYNRTLIK